MSRTPSNMIDLGTIAPNFTLIDTVSDQELSLQAIKGNKATVIFFICNHCPFVIHVNEELVQIANDFKKEGISFVAISSNDVENYPQDAPHLMKKVAEECNYPFPYLYDEYQEVALAYDAACTPDIYVFDKDLKLVYRGQIDDSRPENGVTVTGKDLRNALQNILNGKEISKNQKPSIGCNIKWKVNNE
ncbi:MAG: thioredoxin family protein [Bacteroidetes bacterium]|nr:MAG: thioredoxin family protein [Bacteroidota bacterium]